MRSCLTALGLLVAATLLVTGGAHLVVAGVRDRVHAELASVPARAVVIVPGAGLRSDGTPHGILRERLLCARRLYEAGRVGAVLVSGDGELPAHDEATAMRDWLVGAGVPAAKISMDPAGYRTRDSMERAAAVFGVKDAVICTQDLHARRSVYLALDAGIDAVAWVAAGDDWLDFTAQLRERIATLRAVFDVLSCRALFAGGESGA